MIELFGQLPQRSVSSIKPGQWDFIQRNVQDNLNRYKEHYRYNSSFIGTRHVLIEMLYGLGVSMRQPIEDYYYAVKDRTTSIAMVHQLTTSVNPGHSHASGFYGSNCAQITCVYSQDIDPVKAYADWSKIESVVSLAHPITSYQLPAPFSIKTGDYGVSVIGVDLPLLAIQYRAFLEEQSKQTDQLSAINFICRHVWPNMMPSHMEQVLINRLHAKVFGLKVNDVSIARLPIATIDLNSALRNAEDTIIKRLNEGPNEDIEVALGNIPSFSADTARYSSVLPNVANTATNTWAFYLARLQLLHMLTTVGNGRFVTGSKESLSQISRQLQYSQVSAYLKKCLPPLLASSTQNKLDDLLKSVAA